jgi:hypothetical protein
VHIGMVGRNIEITPAGAVATAIVRAGMVVLLLHVIAALP